ncbi:glutathione S-transferase family protein [Massilia sp. TS11]|uniref:glutathione S-transferase family protein n=1 Tax=Massilia sp. TS11 TaxID=2908003 RepID=UPI001EDAD44C|nr:glutathione S-transferase family protein [Massilia sp. TS11]MCG2584855.1 glutathione S-transferase family protein [Massilia sp. TS11]
MLTIYHVPVCPFCQRLEIVLTLKGLHDQVHFDIVDITQPRPLWLLEKTHGTTAMPVLETSDGRIIKESLVIMQYLEDLLPARPVRRADPYERALENMLVRMEGEFTEAGFKYLLNQDPAQRQACHDRMLMQFARINEFLMTHAPERTFLFDEFGWAEAVFTPLLMRFWFLEYYEDFVLPDAPAYARVAAWRAACVSHPAVQQVTREQIIKSYYDASKGYGNGKMVPGRSVSTFTFAPDWRARPMPPRDKYGHNASDAELGLL